MCLANYGATFLKVVNHSLHFRLRLEIQGHSCLLHNQNRCLSHKHTQSQSASAARLKDECPFITSISTPLYVQDLPPHDPGHISIGQRSAVVWNGQQITPCSPPHTACLFDRLTSLGNIRTSASPCSNTNILAVPHATIDATELIYQVD